MGKLLPDRHPNKDFFILDLKDARPKDDMASMEHPIFSLSQKPDMRTLAYTSSKGDSLRIIPSGHGLATIMDKDILLYCISKLVHEKDAGLPIGPEVEVTAHEIMVACNWFTNGDGYARFEEAMIRLRGTTLTTTIKTGNTETTKIFGLVDEAEVVRHDATGKESAFGRMSRVRLKLSDWMFRSVDSLEVLTISRDYFRLRRPLERRLYEIARKHVGTKNQAWHSGIARLREKVGTKLELRHFKYKLKEIIADANIPDYGFMLDGDMVVMQRLVHHDERPADKDWIPLRPDTLDKAQVIAAQLRVSVFDLEREWNDWAGGKADELKSPDGAFIAFCQQKLGSRHAARYVEARHQQTEAQQLALALPEVPTKR
jgi:Replication initiator protein A